MAEKLKSLPSWVTRGLGDLFPTSDNMDSDQSLVSRLDQASKTKEPLRIKLGIDPTGSEMHLGHSIVFRKLRAFQDAGHKAVLIIGDFTARIGDPTGKSNTRVQLTREQVEANSRTYLEQLGYGKDPMKSLLDFETPERLEVHRNSDWLESLDLTQIIELLGNATVGQMLAKEDFGNRYNSGIPISLHEFLYPLLQGFDSFAVNADIELGGTDQKFNVAMGRDIQRHFCKRPQFGLLMPILVGLDGVNKMSKSLENFVGLNEDPLSMYSKLEKVPDLLVRNYIDLLTDLELKDLPSQPRELQKIMALEVTSNHHGMTAAKAAQLDAARLISGTQDAEGHILELSLDDVNFPAKAFYLLSKLGVSPSSSEARRQIKGGAIRIDGEKILDPNFEFSDAGMLLGKVLQIGKKTFRRLTI